MDWQAFGIVANILLSLVTAIATAMTALIMWRQMRGDIIFEQESRYDWNDGKPSGLAVRFEVRNKTDSSIRLHRVVVLGLPLVAVFTGQKNDKHESWGLNAAPSSLHEVGPGQSGSFSVSVKPDWASWRSVRRSKEYAAWSIIIEYTDKESPMRKRRHTAKLRTHNKMIEQAAQTTENDSIP